MPPASIETVDIRPALEMVRSRGIPREFALVPLFLTAERPTAGSPTAGAPTLSDAQQWDLRSVLEAFSCPHRLQTLLALAAEGRAHVSGLSRRTGICAKSISHHLKNLRTAGLVHSRRRGREVWCEIDEKRIRFEPAALEPASEGQQPSGAFRLTVYAHGGGVAMRMTVGVGNTT